MREQASRLEFQATVFESASVSQLSSYYQWHFDIGQNEEGVPPADSPAAVVDRKQKSTLTPKGDKKVKGNRSREQMLDWAICDGVFLHWSLFQLIEELAMRYTRHSRARWPADLDNPPTSQAKFIIPSEMADSSPDAQQMKRTPCARVRLCAIMRVDSEVIRVGALQAPN